MPFLDSLCVVLSCFRWLGGGWFSSTSQRGRDYDGGQQHCASEYEELVLLDHGHQVA